VVHDNTAYERFTVAGPLALLPIKQDYAVVWTRSTEEAEQLMMASEEDFIARLHACFGYNMQLFARIGLHNSNF
jgi:2-octaprenyl-6-methoxyphenol hydroxylase